MPLVREKVKGFHLILYDRCRLLVEVGCEPFEILQVDTNAEALSAGDLDSLSEA